MSNLRREVVHSMEELRNIGDDISQRVENADYSSELSALMDDLAEDEQEIFESQHDSNNSPWLPLKPSTIKRERQSRILYETGALMKSLVSLGGPGNVHQIDPRFLVFGTDVEDAIFHQFGTNRMTDTLPDMYMQVDLVAKVEGSVRIAMKHADIDASCMYKSQKLLWKFVADHVKSWDLLQVKTHPVDVSPEAMEHLHPILFEKLYLLHSTPRFPAEGEIELPEDECDFGQTFLCITLNFSTTMQIAEIVRTHHEAQVYGFQCLTENEHSPIVKLTQPDRRASEHAKPLFADFPFRSRSRNEFRLFAKNKRWSEPSAHGSQGKDFWNHLVGPALKDNIDVETWRRGEVFENIVPGSNTVTLDVLGINLESLGHQGYEWSFTKDHAKWGSTEHRPAGLFLRHPGFVVIADINRDESQAKRGGGGIAFQHDGIWRALKSVKKVETTVHKSAHHAR